MRRHLTRHIAIAALSLGACAADPATDSSTDFVGVRLEIGDNHQQANDQHPAGTAFLVAAGTHLGQRVVNPKKGNRWTGEEGAILDGQNALTDAFHGRAEQIVIEGLEIRNYVDNGLAFRDGREVTLDRLTVRDTGSGDGEGNGAVRFFNVGDLTVTRCHFTRVSSGVLPTECPGPIRIEWNTGVNTGRNFVQLDKCAGGGIRVRYNTMERVGDYLRPGAEDVEDWISVYKVRGLPDDPAQFNYNRARGHGTSGSGSFIMLGDGGGIHLEAVGNIGVTPGQVGIGLSGGEHIQVRSNFMFSDVWPQSNIAYYSSNYGAPAPCGNHLVAANRANWLNRQTTQNTFWTNDTCGSVTLENNTFPDTTLTADIWNQWPSHVQQFAPRSGTSR